MGNSLRCCLACVLPCGVLDLIRIVHINGHVEEYSRPVAAKEILEANPNHVISRPCSQGGVSHSIMIVSPDSELKRGNIYFLIPAASALQEKKKKKRSLKSSTKTVKMPDQEIQVPAEEKKKGRHRREKGRVAVWRPHLESIFED